MLIVALVAAFLLYVGLFFFWQSAQPQLDTPPAFVETVRDLVFFMPESPPMALLKWGLIMLAFYLVADALISHLKRDRRKTPSTNLHEYPSDSEANKP
ncbi:MAG TPA: hypothetical protein VF719_04000 [Abditibacteriaceae bacterium]|jgi:divalent metal cation (Fe/Co/Zn/Cd) transporter